jgi:hypothetical protein
MKKLHLVELQVLSLLDRLGLQEMMYVFCVNQDTGIITCLLMVSCLWLIQSTPFGKPIKITVVYYTKQFIKLLKIATE